MPNKSIKVNGVTYQFAHNFELIENIQENTSIGLRKLYKEICEEKEDCNEVVAVIQAAIITKEGEKVDFKERRSTAIEIYNELGVIKSAYLVHDILIECMAGKEDTKKLKSGTMFNYIRTLINSRLMSLKKVILLWVVVSVISAGSLCGIFSLLSQAFL
tara:strand:+ start:272 stop:748 length:477 start_codon:yes stop_codon:yes gene_type:complete